MKWLINERGMMFGNRINIIDFVVAMFIFSLTPCLYYGWKLYKAPKAPKTPKTTIEIKLSEYETLQKSLQRKEAQIQEFLKEHKRARKYFK